MSLLRQPSSRDRLQLGFTPTETCQSRGTFPFHEGA